LGYDVLVDEDFNPVLLEVNHSPSLTCDTPLDLRIKEGLISGVLDLLWICQDDKILNQKLDEIRQLKSLYKVNSDKDRIFLEQKTAEILKSQKGPHTAKKMPTYASVVKHYQKVCQQNKNFTWIYPPQNEEDKYLEIINQLKTPQKLLSQNNNTQDKLLQQNMSSIQRKQPTATSTF